MSFSSSLSLVRLRELKLWQGSYENILQNSKTKSQPSQFEHIEGVSVLDNSIDSVFSLEEGKRNTKDWDTKTIMPSKPFEQLLEEKLAEDTPMEAQVKPKRPFLKKGQGLARFKMGGVPLVNNKNKYTAPKKPQGSQKNTRPNILPAARKGILKKSNPFYHQEVDLSPLTMPDFVKPRGTWKSVFQSCEIKNDKKDDGEQDEVENYEEFRKSLSFGESKSVNDNNGGNPLEDENHVFTKSSSRRVLDTPKSNDDIDNREESSFKSNFHSLNKEILEQLNEYAQKYFVSPTQRFSSNDVPENVSELTTPKLTSRVGDTTLYEQKMEKELRIFEALEKKVESSSFCSTNTSIANLLASTPQKAANINERNDGVDNNELSHSLEISDNILFTNDRHEDIQLKLQEVAQKTDVLQHFLMNLRKMEHKSTQENFTQESDLTKKSEKSMSTNTSFSDENTRWSSRSPSLTDNYTEFDTTCLSDSWKKIDAGVNTSFDNSGLNETVKKLEPCKECENLSSRLSETKFKLDEIQSEKSDLKIELRDLEKKFEQLKKDMKREKERYEEKVESLQEELGNERKKLIKEKTYFETYVKECQNRPSKKEREEITQLKQELADAKELLKLKDTKNGATQARLRNQIKQQEKDISELKITVEKLQRENAKLTANQKFMRRPQEVKMLHEINKNLSKLTEETFKKQLCKSGNGDAAENGEKNSKEPKLSGNIDEKSANKENEKHGKNVNNKEVQKTTVNKDSFRKDNSTLDLTNSEGLSIEKQYEHVFGNFASPKNSNNSANLDKMEKKLPDGSIEITYSNGNFKTISSDGQLVIMKYFNGDIKETNLRDKVIRYHYATTDSWHTQYPDGTEVIEYKDGQKCKKFTDGKTEVSYPDGSVRIINSDGTEEQQFPDGRKTLKNSLGEVIILLPNGQREIHTKEYKFPITPSVELKEAFFDWPSIERYLMLRRTEHDFYTVQARSLDQKGRGNFWPMVPKRREYPDGTIRTLRKDGSVETVYANGRVRLKDSSGTLILDTHHG